MPVARLISLAALLIAEAAVLIVRFSTESLAATGHEWWAHMLWRSKFVLLPLAIAMSTAGVLLGGDRLRADLRRVSAEVTAPHRAWPYLLAHLTAFAIFACITDFILEGGFATSSIQPFWVATWLTVAATTAMLWASIMCAPRVLVAVAWRTRALVFAIVVVGTMAWAAGLITEGWWDPLRHATMNVVAAMIHVIASDAVFVPDELTVGTERFSVQIWSACAGYEGIGLIWVFLSAYLVMCREELRFPRALLLIPIGTVVVWVANALRLTALILIGTWVSPDVALGGFHAYSGSLLFSGIAIALVFIARRSSFFTLLNADDHTLTAHEPNVTAAYLMPFLAIVATQMVAGAVSTGAGFDVLYPLRVVTTIAALVCFRRVYHGLRWTCSWEAVAIGALVFGLWMALEPTPDPANQAAFAASLHALSPVMTVFWLIARVVGSVVTVPIAEELAFRGYLGRRLVARNFEQVPFQTFTWFAFFGSSVLFGVMHGRWLAGSLAGMLYALLLYRRGEIGDAISAHAITNAMIAGYVLATGSWLLW